MSNPSTVTHPAVSGGAIGLGAPSIPGSIFLHFCYWALSSSVSLWISDVVCSSLLNYLNVSLPCIAALKHPRTPPTNPSVDYPSGDSDHVSKRTRPMGISDEVILFGSYCTHQNKYISGQHVNSCYYLTPSIPKLLSTFPFLDIAK
jgi:hypothetical protein